MKEQPNFFSFGFTDEINRAIERLDFKTPTRIQENAIPRLLTGDRDMIGLAQTGTGKTAAFGLPLVQMVDFENSASQGLILCPTRELCLQIAGDLNKFARHIPKARIASVYGGAGMREQILYLKKGAQIIVATPGRLLDLTNRKVAKLQHIAYLVLDEADEMLHMGFQEDIDAILSRTPAHKRTWLFSATMPAAAAQIAEKYMTRPETVTAGRHNSAVKSISHSCYVFNEKNRFAALRRIIDYMPNIFGLVFCRTRMETQAVADKLMRNGYRAEALHGDLSQSQRDLVMGKFRSGALQLLVATDVAARGLDVDDITHVINYNLPEDPERYTHRCGRTGRAGKSGESIVLVTPRELPWLKRLEAANGIGFEHRKIPSGRSICIKQLKASSDRLVSEEINPEEIDEFLPSAMDALSGLSKEELIRRFLSVDCGRFIKDYRNAEEINAKAAKTQKRPNRGGQYISGKTTKFFINVGRLDKLKEGAIVRLVCDKSGISSKKLGRIDLKREFSFFDVEQSVAKRVLKSLKGATMDGRKISARFAEDRRRAGKRQAFSRTA